MWPWPTVARAPRGAHPLFHCHSRSPLSPVPVYGPAAGPAAPHAICLDVNGFAAVIDAVAIDDYDDECSVLHRACPGPPGCVNPRFVSTLRTFCLRNMQWCTPTRPPGAPLEFWGLAPVAISDNGPVIVVDDRGPHTIKALGFGPGLQQWSMPWVPTPRCQALLPPAAVAAVRSVFHIAAWLRRGAAFGADLPPCTPRPPPLELWLLILSMLPIGALGAPPLLCHCNRS